MINLNNILKPVEIFIKKNAGYILTGIGIGGMVATTIMAVKATPEAMEKIEEAKDEKEGDSLTKAETIKVCYKCYIPAVITGVFSISCIIGGSAVNYKRNIALATAYEISQTALDTYKEETRKVVGEEKAKEIQHSVNKKALDNHPYDDDAKPPIIVSDGDVLCYDSYSDRYWKSSMESIKSAINEVDKQMRNENYISLNEVYYEMGLPGVSYGTERGWTIDDGYVEVEFDAQIATNNKPCLVVMFDRPPKEGFSMFG